MFTCGVCGANSFRNEAVTEVFDVDGRRVLVENIPVLVCLQCGEAIFGSETAERVRQTVRGEISESEILQRVDALLARLTEQNAMFSEDEAIADIDAAIEEVRSGHDG